VLQLLLLVLRTATNRDTTAIQHIQRNPPADNCQPAAFVLKVVVQQAAQYTATGIGTIMLSHPSTTQVR
jgi:hypothetical protein